MRTKACVDDDEEDKGDGTFRTECCMPTCFMHTFLDGKPGVKLGREQEGAKPTRSTLTMGGGATGIPLTIDRMHGGR